MAVHLLQGAGRKQGNLGRFLFFEIGKQRGERHLTKSRCRLKDIGYGDLLRLVVNRGGMLHYSAVGNHSRLG